MSGSQEITTTKQDDRLDALADMILAEGDKAQINELAIKVGYSHSYANSQIYKTIQSKAFKDRIIEKAKAKELLDLQKILDIRQGALDEYVKEPKLAIEKPQMYQNLRRDIGLSQSEGSGTGNTFISIGTLQQLVCDSQETAKKES